jgi:hypothetical protein
MVRQTSADLEPFLVVGRVGDSAKQPDRVRAVSFGGRAISDTDARFETIRQQPICRHPSAAGSSDLAAYLANEWGVYQCNWTFLPGGFESVSSSS